jgi:tetratricopeptide (TPR) repeat protein
MRHVAKVLLMVVLAGSQLFAQGDPQEQLREACALGRQGEFDKAIHLAKELIDSGQPGGVFPGRAWIVLGVVYSQQGRFVEAQDAFERSLRILEGTRFVTDYADAIQNYGQLYNQAGEITIAGQMWRKALEIRQQAGDHEGISRSLTSLAGFALSQRHVGEARKYLQGAAEEAKLTHDLTDDDVAIGYETQAWLTMAEGHPAAAVADYDRALEVCKRIHGDKHWLTGWEYMLRGKAYSYSGNVNQALDDMRAGLRILDQVLGRKNPRYFAAQIAYATALDRAGLRAQAAQWRAAGEQAQKDFYRSQCVGCTINVAAFR